MFQINPLLESRCKHYNTTLSLCGCIGFGFRKYCKHTTYLTEKIGHKSIELDTISRGIPTSGMDVFEAIDLYGELTVEEMKALGHAFERMNILIPLR